MVGTNFSFCVPCLVTSVGFLARLPIALVGEDGRDACRLESEAPGFDEDGTAFCRDLAPEA